MLVIIDDQPLPPLGGDTGDALAKPQAHIFEPCTSVVPGAWTQRVRHLVPEIDNTPGCPQQGCRPLHDQIEECGEVQLPRDLLGDGVHGLHLRDTHGQSVLGLLALRDIDATHNDPSDLAVLVTVRQLVRLYPPQRSSSRGMGYDDVALWLACPDDFQIISVIPGGG